MNNDLTRTAESIFMSIEKEETKTDVDSRKMKQSFFESIINQTEDHVFVVDKDYRLMAFNQLHQKEFSQRFNVDSRIGGNLIDSLQDYPEAKARMLKLVDKALQGEKTILDEYQSTKKTEEGYSAYYQMQCLPMWDDDDNVIGAALMYRDITHRVITDEKIEHVIRHTADLTEDEFFNDLTLQMYKMFGANHIYIGLFDEATNTVSTRAHRNNGKQISNVTYALEDTPDEVVMSQKAFQSFEAAQNQFKHDPKLKKWNGYSYWGIPVFSPTSGAVLGIFVMINDAPIPKFPNIDYLFNVIALRTGAEIQSIHNLAALKAHERQLMDITHNVPDVIYECVTKADDSSNYFTFISRAAEDMYETSLEEIYENPEVIWKSIHPDDYVDFISVMQTSIANLKSFNWTGRLVGIKTYQLRWVKITAKPQVANSEELKWHGVINDISRIKYIEQELLHAKKRAEESAAAKEDFLAIMSHEIRTPLNGIVGITDIMIDEASPEQMEYLNLLKFSAENLMTLINNILDFSKLNAGKIEISEIKVHLKLLLKNLRHAHSFRAQENGNDLNFIVDPAIPDVIMGDDMVLLQILNNLIGNAIKFTRSGKVELKLSVAEQTDDNIAIRFEVSDTGIGISKDDLNIIFDKFQQVGDKSQKAGGTGLGLGIVKMLINALHSDLKVKSTLGEGTSFYFTINFKKHKDLTVGAGTSDSQALATEKELVNLLLVEDVAENREMLVRFLTKTGDFNISTAANGQEAVDAIKENQYDIVLMDLRMPIMDGREAAKIVREQNTPSAKSLPIVALTADSFDINTEPHFTDVILKPFSPRELQAKVMDIVKK